MTAVDNVNVKSERKIITDKPERDRLSRETSGRKEQQVAK